MMKKFVEYGNILQSVELFATIEQDDLDTMLGCLDAKLAYAKKDEIVLLSGQRPEHVGIVMSGQLHIVKEDAEGNRILVAGLQPGEIFAEALCAAGVGESPVTVLADTDSAILRLRFDRVIHPCGQACEFHGKLVENLLGLIARKNLLLQSRMEIMAIRSVREKVLRYLGSFAMPKGEKITIPFNREELADYLCVERSALSHTLSRMKQDGLLEYRKNELILLP